MKANEAKKLVAEKRPNKLSDAYYRIKMAASKGFTDTYAPVGLLESEVEQLVADGYRVEEINGKLNIFWD